MKSFWFILILFLFVFVFVKCASIEKAELKSHSHAKTNYLEIYGKKIYERENCASCHKLEIDSLKSGLWSLDGIGGFRSTDWFYNFFDTPKSLIPGTIMPKYRHLYKTSFQETILQSLQKEFNLNSNEYKEIIEQINFKADSLFATIESDIPFPKARTEILALIEFIQNIPRSNSKRELDIQKNKEYQLETEMYDRLYKDSDSLIMAIARNPENIEKGRILFNNNCIACHADEGAGMIGPNLTDEYWIYGNGYASIAKTVINGTLNGMPPHRYKLTPSEVGEVSAYVYTLRQFPKKGKAPQGTKE